MMPPRVLASGPKPCGGNNIYNFCIELISYDITTVYILVNRRRNILISYFHSQNSAAIINLRRVQFSGPSELCTCIE